MSCVLHEGIGLRYMFVEAHGNTPHGYPAFYEVSTSSHDEISRIY
jgi:hypothetical protein